MMFLLGAVAGVITGAAAIVWFFLHTWFGPGTGWPQ